MRKAVTAISTLAIAAMALMLSVSLPARAAARETARRASAAGPPSMTKPEMDAFLARPLVARLATVRPNGTPQVVPMWFIWEKGAMYMSTRVNAAKLKHIRANPHVAVVVDVMEAPLRNKSVNIDGTAQIETDNVKQVVEKIYRKYVGPKAMKGPLAQHNMNEPRVVLKITPKHIISIDTTRR